MSSVVYCFFFFQAEDGIRDLTVTGVQTCALPICSLSAVDALEQCTATVLSATGGVLSSGTLDVLPTPGDVVAQAGGTASGTATTIRHLGPETAGLPSIISVTNGITIIFKRPP